MGPSASTVVKAAACGWYAVPVTRWKNPVQSATAPVAAVVMTR